MGLRVAPNERRVREVREGRERSVRECSRNVEYPVLQTRRADGYELAELCNLLKLLR